MTVDQAFQVISEEIVDAGFAVNPAEHPLALAGKVLYDCIKTLEGKLEANLKVTEKLLKQLAKPGDGEA